MDAGGSTCGSNNLSMTPVAPKPGFVLTVVKKHAITHMK